MCTQTFAWGKKLIRGNQHEVGNPLRRDAVKMNLPGDEMYDPSMPWVYKWDEKNEMLASDFACYIDNIQGLGRTKKVC